jgi:DNA repair protein SbcC/Rad50
VYIKKIELEDIKSHAHFVREFSRGTTAIMGANGAGKSTLIEAVAWTLFDLLDYKKDDFLRRGAKKGSATVTFESSLDEREYRVFRDTRTSYYVYDPKLKMRVADKKEEVQRFLWQHLGVESGTDLEALFRNAVGVPQGTFTADFLKAAGARKPIFDKLLKVEEYRQGAEKLLETVNFIKAKEVEIGNKIAFAKGKLEDFERIETEFADVQKDAETLSGAFEKLEKEFAEREKTVAGFDEQEAKVSELKALHEKLANEKSRSEVVLAQKEKEKDQAAGASEKIRATEADHKLHTDALGKLQEFERERIERDKLDKAIAEVKEAIYKVQTEERSIKTDLEKIAAAHREIESLKPKLGTQSELEAQREELGREIAKTDEVEKSIAKLETRMNSLREKLFENRRQIERAEENEKKSEMFEKHIKRDEEIKNELARFRAKLESDRKFQAEIKNGLCPILSEKCLNLKEGETLESFVSGQFVDLEEKIEGLEIEQREVAVVVESSRKAEKEAFALKGLTERKKEITDEGLALKAEKEQAEAKLEKLPELEKELAAIRAKLETLGSPRERIKILEAELEREISVREHLTQIESNFERLESERRLKVEQLETYKDLDENWQTWTAKRDATAAAHREYLSNETLAKSLPEKTKELAAARKEIGDLSEKLERAAKDFETENEKYDREKHILEKSERQNVERKLFETKTNLEHARRRKKDLKESLQKLKAIKLSLGDDIDELERLEKVGEATAFIRNTLKEAAPRVAQNYVFHVSIEATQLFRDITGNAERTLKWAEDYGIVLEENGFERPFVNLSGGEQMAAALSVRLALLKQLSDVNLAFFDEPTMNMDAERRERLAEQISSITENQTFEQLFVISHDDTFENHVDHVLTLSADDEE